MTAEKAGFPRFPLPLLLVLGQPTLGNSSLPWSLTPQPPVNPTTERRFLCLSELNTNLKTAHRKIPLLCHGLGDVNGV